MSIKCKLGFHNYVWNVAPPTKDSPQLNWEECKRCGKVKDEFKHHWEEYQKR